tara:strand:+ start:770 stop:1819 length:1050 start_codon:yes stop_codon:yes gene_type:complete
MEKPFKRGLLGGTFDHFHKGHEKLIMTALEKCDFIEIWITSDEIASKKEGDVESFEDRFSFINQWINSKNEQRDLMQGEINHRIITKKLDDDVGPAEWRTDCDAIICTKETLPNCEKINHTRKKSNLSPLNIISVEHFLTEENTILSSSLIRKGICNRNGKLWISEKITSNTYELPTNVEKKLKKPFGTLFEGPEDQPQIAMSNFVKECGIKKHKGKIIAVGDVCVSALRSIDIIPDVAVVDGMTKRQMLPENERPDFQGYQKIIECKNPAGKITPEFSSCLISAAKSQHKTIINVNGEEDLAPLILHLALPLDSYLVYGQPFKGVVVSISNEEVKERCKTRLNEFDLT